MKIREIYRCSHCKLQIQITAVENQDIPAPMCCGEAMTLQQPNTVDAAKEKHVPVIEPDGSGTRVRVGSVAHPTLPEHFIEWIELENGTQTCRVYITPGEAPEAYFAVPYSAELKAVTSCNLHGVWRDR